MNHFNLIFITNNTQIASIADRSGINEIFIDLEKKGKELRQPGLNTVKSNHKLSDIVKIKPLLKTSKLLVRCNPIGSWSKVEIKKIIDAGADTIMLPFFKTKSEVEDFIGYVDGKTKTCLLVETLDAVNNLVDILDIKSIDRIHIGLNDIHIESKSKFMFEPFENGMLEEISILIKSRNINFGIGGISKIGSSLRPSPEMILVEHMRLGSSSVILSRSFLDLSIEKDTRIIKERFTKGVEDIRNWELEISKWTTEMLNKNHKKISNEIKQIVRNI